MPIDIKQTEQDQQLAELRAEFTKACVQLIDKEYAAGYLHAKDLYKDACTLLKQKFANDQAYLQQLRSFFDEKNFSDFEFKKSSYNRYQNETKFGILKFQLVDAEGRKQLFRFYQSDAYAGPNTNDFLERMVSIVDAAKAAIPGDDPQGLEKIRLLNKQLRKFMQAVEKSADLSPNIMQDAMHSGQQLAELSNEELRRKENAEAHFDEKFKIATKLIQSLTQQASIILDQKHPDKAMKRIAQTEKELMSRRRPILVNTFQVEYPDGAQPVYATQEHTPVHRDRTVASSLRDEEGVANYVESSIRVFTPEGEQIHQGSFYRSASVTPNSIVANRSRFNEITRKNLRFDIMQRLAQDKIAELPEQDGLDPDNPIKLDYTLLSLVSPRNIVSDKIAPDNPEVIIPKEQDKALKRFSGRPQPMLVQFSDPSQEEGFRQEVRWVQLDPTFFNLGVNNQRHIHKILDWQKTQQNINHRGYNSLVDKTQLAINKKFDTLALKMQEYPDIKEKNSDLSQFKMHAGALQLNILSNLKPIDTAKVDIELRELYGQLDKFDTITLDELDLLDHWDKIKVKDPENPSEYDFPDQQSKEQYSHLIEKESLLHQALDTLAAQAKPNEQALYNLPNFFRIKLKERDGERLTGNERQLLNAVSETILKSHKQEISTIKHQISHHEKKLVHIHREAAKAREATLLEPNYLASVEENIQYLENLSDKVPEELRTECAELASHFRAFTEFSKSYKATRDVQATKADSQESVDLNYQPNKFLAILMRLNGSIFQTHCKSGVDRTSMECDLVTAAEITTATHKQRVAQYQNPVARDIEDKIFSAVYQSGCSKFTVALNRPCRGILASNAWFNTQINLSLFNRMKKTQKGAFKLPSSTKELKQKETNAEKKTSHKQAKLAGRYNKDAALSEEESNLTLAQPKPAPSALQQTPPGITIPTPSELAAKRPPAPLPPRRPSTADENASSPIPQGAPVLSPITTSKPENEGDRGIVARMKEELAKTALEDTKRNSSTAMYPPTVGKVDPKLLERMDQFLSGHDQSRNTGDRNRTLNKTQLPIEKSKQSMTLGNEHKSNSGFGIKTVKSTVKKILKPRKKAQPGPKQPSKE